MKARSEAKRDESRFSRDVTRVAQVRHDESRFMERELDLPLWQLPPSPLF